MRDWLAPLSSTVLDGVRHIALPTGHSGLLVDGEVAEVVVELLRSESRRSPVDAHPDDTLKLSSFEHI